MSDEINIALRGIVLREALKIENGINQLVLFELGIFSDGKGTALFSEKVGLSFQAKVNLLSDLKRLNKEDKLDLELAMNFRNKFLHQLSCNTFLKALGSMSSSSGNRLQSHMQGDKVLETEEDCIEAFELLCVKNQNVLYEKLKVVKEHGIRTQEFLHLLNDSSEFYIDLFADFYSEVSLTLEKTLELIEKGKPTNQFKTIEELKQICELYVPKFALTKEKASKINEFYSSKEFISRLFGIRATH
jgi:hypothetical protein